jgi:endonuclease YncB( thermonuclease family)
MGSVGLRVFLVLLLLPALLAAHTGSADDAAHTLTLRTPRAVDGDTVADGPATYDLFGVRAPRIDRICHGPQGPWPCGEAARAALDALIRPGPITCTVFATGPDHRRTLRCPAAGHDIAASLLRRRLAKPRRPTLPLYFLVQMEARNAGRGLWRDGLR